MSSINDKSSIIPDSKRLSHAYIADGDIVDSLAMAAVCSTRGSEKPCLICTHCDKASRHIHPDIIYVDKLDDKREIVVDQIRELKRDVLVVPNEADKKVYIIHNADTMNISAQNAFLRMLEEPPSHAIFILKTSNPISLLSTVRSRCVSLHPGLPAATSSSFDEDPENEVAVLFLTSLTSGNAALLDIMFRLEKLDKPAFSTFLTCVHEQILLLLRESVYTARDTHQNTSTRIKPETLSQAERIIIKAGEMLELNVSTGHISGMICASFVKS